jgi:tetratricopeptide (TPR) repeat protein
VASIVGVLGVVIAYSQMQFSKEVEGLRAQIAGTQIAVARSEMAAALMDPLIKGTESERIIAMILLESAGDSVLAARVFQGLALHDRDVAVRLQAIEALRAGVRMGAGEEGGVATTLARIEERGETEEERAAARVILFESNVRKGRVYSELGRWRLAAEYYRRASGYSDSSRVDVGRLEAARVYMEREAFEDAVRLYEGIYAESPGDRGAGAVGMQP